VVKVGLIVLDAHQNVKLRADSFKDIIQHPSQIMKTSIILSAIACLLATKNVVSFAPMQTASSLRSVKSKESVFNINAGDKINSQLNAFDPSALASMDSSSLLTSLEVLTNENISKAFNVATFGPQILWAFMILIPNTKFTKTIMGSYAPIIAFSLVHLFIVVASALQDNGTAPLVEFNDVFDPSGDPQAAMINMMRYPNFVSEEWSHVLTWDLFVGRWIWLDGLKRGIFTGHSVLFCNLIGPPGFLIHCATCLLTGKGIVGNEATDDE
jgi:hypothetical protein